MATAPVITGAPTCATVIHFPPQDSPPFDPSAWLADLARVGGGFALTSNRRLAFIVDQCDGGELATVMAELTGRPDRQEAVKRAIEQRQNGEAC